MLERCYDTNYVSRNPTYATCSVCEEWLTFSNFKKWMEKQDWKGKQLDKDLIVPGNKIYSPDACIFVDSMINTILNDHEDQRGEFPKGVKANGWKYSARCSVNGKRVHIGTFETPEIAAGKYREYKYRWIMTVANKQEDNLKHALQRHAKLIINDF